LQNGTFCPISASGSNFNPRNILYIPVVEIFAFLELENSFLSGNGHIIRKFGIPDRVFSRIKEPFRTIFPARSGTEANLSYADYIWVTPQKIPKNQKLNVNQR